VGGGGGDGYDHFRILYTVFQLNNLWWTNRPGKQSKPNTDSGVPSYGTRNDGVLPGRSIIRYYRLLCGAACVIRFLIFSDPAFVQCRSQYSTQRHSSIVILYYYYCYYVLRSPSDPKTDNDTVWNNITSQIPITYIYIYIYICYFNRTHKII